LILNNEHINWYNTKSDHTAAKFIIQQAHKYPGELQIVSLGALTNVAWAIKLDPSIIPKIKKITYMGMGKRLNSSQTTLYPFPAQNEPFSPGNVYTFFPNHNISADTMAAYKVFETSIPIDVINDTVTNQLWFGIVPRKTVIDGNPVDYLISSENPPETHVVGQLLFIWLKHRSSKFGADIKGTCPHDGLALAEAIYTNRFVKYIRGHLLVHEWAGFSSFVLDPKGPHRIGTQIDAELFLNFFTAKLLPDFPLAPDFYTKVLEDKNLGH